MFVKGGNGTGNVSAKPSLWIRGGLGRILKAIVGLPCPFLHDDLFLGERLAVSPYVLCRSPSIMDILGGNRIFLEKTGVLDGARLLCGGQNVEQPEGEYFPSSLWDETEGDVMEKS